MEPGNRPRRDPRRDEGESDRIEDSGEPSAAGRRSPRRRIDARRARVRDRHAGEEQREKPREEVAFGAAPAPRQGSIELVAVAGREKRTRRPREIGHLREAPAHSVEARRGPVRQEKRQPEEGADGEREERAGDPASAFRALHTGDGLEEQDHPDQQPSEESVLETGDAVPREEDGEQNGVPATPRVQIAQQEEALQAEEASPLHVEVRELRELVRKEREDHARGERGRGISGDVAREPPAGPGREEDREEQVDVVVRPGRRARGEQREAEDRAAVVVLRERQRVARGVEDRRLEEIHRVPERLAIVPLQDPRLELGVAQVGRPVGEVSRLGPGHQHGERRVERRGEQRVAPARRSVGHCGLVSEAEDATTIALAIVVCPPSFATSVSRSVCGPGGIGGTANPKPASAEPATSG